jgi:soluble P-type ATPase
MLADEPLLCSTDGSVCVIKSEDGQSNRTKNELEIKVLNLNKVKYLLTPTKSDIGSKC